MAAKKKSASRKSAAKKAAKTRKKRTVGKKAAATRKGRPAAASPADAELDERIALVRNNLRDLTEQAAASSGASNEELMSDRIAEQEARLQLLIRQREQRARRRGS